MSEEPTPQPTVTIGRYFLHRQIARGGMATIHIARLMGDEGFSRIVAAKRLLPEFAEDTEFVAMFMDEARIASKVHHPNVVPVVDLVTTTDEVMLVQEYVHGVPLHVLLRTARETKIPVPIAISIACQVLAGLQAAHTTVDEMGVPLDIVHRDVSPQNVMIAIDGSARLLDFGIAKATMAAHVTRDGMFKGKLAYSSPEQVQGRPVQQSDIYALTVVLWELLVGHRMHGGQAEAELVATILNGTMPTITEALSNESDWGAIDSDEWSVLTALEPIVQKGLATQVAQRYATAAEMARDLADAVAPASTSEVAAWVKSLGKEFLDSRDKIIAAEEASWRRSVQAQSHRAGDTRLAKVLPPAPAARGGKAIIAVIGMLIVLLGVGVVYAVQAPDAPPSRASAAVTPVEIVLPAPERAPAPPPIAAPVGEPAPVPTVAPEPEPPAPPYRPPLRPPPKPVVEPPPLPPPAPVVEPKPAEQPKVEQANCTPPYYFEGQKKVFKPNCL